MACLSRAFSTTDRAIEKDGSAFSLNPAGGRGKIDAMTGRALIEKLGFAERPENIRWSYDDREFSLRADPSEVYLEHPPSGLPTRPGSVREESFRAARLISEKHGKPVILYSGGIDSEAVLLSFYLQKLPFEVVIIDYLGFNDHDTNRARAFCEKLGVPFRLFACDVFGFWEDDLQDMAKKIHCTSPQVAALCWVVTQLDGYVIVGDGDSHLRRAGQRFFETKSERWALARWMMLQEKEGCPRFFQYTNALEASLLFEPMVEQFISSEMWDFLDFRKFMYLKPFLFHHRFGCELRPKWTGFERIEQCEFYRQGLSALLGASYDVSWSYDEGRRWALASTPPSRWVPIRESNLDKTEKNELSPNATSKHLIWTD